MNRFQKMIMRTARVEGWRRECCRGERPVCDCERCSIERFVVQSATDQVSRARREAAAAGRELATVRRALADARHGLLLSHGERPGDIVGTVRFESLALGGDFAIEARGPRPDVVRSACLAAVGELERMAREQPRKPGKPITDEVRAAARRRLADMDKRVGGRDCGCSLCRPGGAPWPPPTFGVDLGSGRDRSVVHQVDGTKVQPPAPPLVVGEPGAPAAPQASAAPRPADGPPEAPIATEAGRGAALPLGWDFAHGGPLGQPLDSEVAAALSAKIGDTIDATNGRVFGFYTDRRHCDEGFPLPRSGVILDDPMPPSSCRPSAAQAETQKAALANVATASKAAAADPASATLSATLAGLRAAEEAMKTALTQFEAQFRGCAVNDVRIERVSKSDGSSRIAGVLIDLKLQNVQP